MNIPDTINYAFLPAVYRAPGHGPNPTLAKQRVNKSLEPCMNTRFWVILSILRRIVYESQASTCQPWPTNSDDGPAVSRIDLPELHSERRRNQLPGGPVRARHATGEHRSTIQ